jgi:hypothetical protein
MFSNFFGLSENKTSVHETLYDCCKKGDLVGAKAAVGRGAQIDYENEVSLYLLLLLFTSRRAS